MNSMTEAELRRVLARGEDSRHQFKRDAANADGMAAELAALANSGGGQVLIGVADDGGIVGLDATSVGTASSPARHSNSCCTSWG